MAYTVFHPDALARSKCYRAMTMQEMQADREGAWDEMYFFQYPSDDLVDDINGDGRLWTVDDYSTDLTKLFCGNRTFLVNPQTTIYVR